jgi:hypothetical protein
VILCISKCKWINISRTDQMLYLQAVKPITKPLFLPCILLLQSEAKAILFYYILLHSYCKIWVLYRVMLLQILLGCINYVFC